MPTVIEKRNTFRTLHARGCFVMPNPWDVGSARYLAGLGFKALASTSAGYAFTRGLPDSAVGRDRMLDHLHELCAAVDVPINADFEGGYAHEPEQVFENVGLCLGTGVAGLSIEDFTGDPAAPLYDLEMAVARIRATRAAIDRAGGEAIFTARTECFVVGRPDLHEATERLNAYAEAGADCVYAPGLNTREQIDVVVRAVAPTPVNVLMSGASGMTVADAAALGVRRISVGSALARVAWGSMIRAAREVLVDGTFDAFAGAAPHPELNRFFRDEMNLRGPK